MFCCWTCLIRVIFVWLLKTVFSFSSANLGMSSDDQIHGLKIVAKGLHACFWWVPLTWWCFMQCSLAPMFPAMPTLPVAPMLNFHACSHGVIVRHSELSVSNTFKSSLEVIWHEEGYELVLWWSITQPGDMCHFGYPTMSTSVNTKRA